MTSDVLTTDGSADCSKERSLSPIVAMLEWTGAAVSLLACGCVGGEGARGADEEASHHRGRRRRHPQARHAGDLLAHVRSMEAGGRHSGSSHGW